MRLACSSSCGPSTRSSCSVGASGSGSGIWPSGQRSGGSRPDRLVLALAASLSWGVGDFIGGFKTRRLGTFAVLFLSQPAALAMIAAVVIVRGVPFRPGPWMVAGVLAGLIGLVGLAAIYRGMAIGVVSVVSTIAATGPVVPVLVGLTLGERPGGLQLAGMALTLGGVALLAFDRRPAQPGRRLVPVVAVPGRHRRAGADRVG